ncbi:MAG: hypothetical protein IGS03_04715 [Candidatus Sericytochromatia bacterium]|nr:hypothetical protein [Candidatus Sericytochromatia bacterium]
MKKTLYFEYTQQRPDRQDILEVWILAAITHPIDEMRQSDGRIRRWTWVEERNRYLRVVLLADGETVHKGKGLP